MLRLSFLAALFASTSLLQPTPPTPPAAPATPPGHNHHDHAGHNHGDAKDLNGILEKTEEFSTLVGLLKQADLTDAIETGGPYTLFAPTNDAFAKLPEATLESLAKPENKDLLKKILLSHIVKGALKSSDLKPGPLQTLSGTQITIALKDNKPTLNGTPLEDPDITAENGILHGIPSVLLPK